MDNGTVMNGKLIESPKSFQVACTVMTQIISAVASSQYGGQSVDLKHLGKYLRKSHDKYEKAYRAHFGDEFDDDTIEKLVQDRLKDELKSGVLDEFCIRLIQLYDYPNRFSQPFVYYSFL